MSQKLTFGSTGEPLALGQKIGEGGEGIVWAVKDNPSIVVKIYREKDDAEPQRKKVIQLSRMTAPELQEIAAWPIDYIVDDQGDAVGFSMNYIRGSMPLFSAYQIKTRTKRLPQATFQFLVRAARNLSACVHRVHESGFVIGDLNESNTLIDGKAMVKLIDTDSIQMTVDGKLLVCPVAKLELLAPELHGLDLELNPRSENHDRFSLAVLIFQILMFGRHPFAGRNRDGDDTSLEWAIQNGHYAYTNRRASHIAPPNLLDLNHLPPALVQLFEDAFDPKVSRRPEAVVWFNELKKLEDDLETCDSSPLHHYWKDSSLCPWCRLEKQWQIVLFGQSGQPDNLAHKFSSVEAANFRTLLDQIPDPTESQFPSFPAPISTYPVKVGAGRKFVSLILKNQFFILLFAWTACLIFIQPVYAAIAVWAVLSAATAIILWLTKIPQKKKTVQKNLRDIGETYYGLAAWWNVNASPVAYFAKKSRAYNLVEKLNYSPEMLRSHRQAMLQSCYANLLNLFLKKYSIMAAEIPSALGAELRRRMMTSGILTASDITDANLDKATYIKDNVRSEIIAWRQKLEDQYWATSSHALTPDQVKTMESRIHREITLAKEELEQLEKELRAESHQIIENQALLLQHYGELSARTRLMSDDLNEIESVFGVLPLL